VLADEPTANLDHKTGEGILQLMKNINVEFKTTFIFSTHDRRVMELADRLVHIEDGRIVTQEVRAGGPAAVIERSPATNHPLVQGANQSEADGTHI
jgi:putative ABC transport system ATP-binding protein